MKKIIFIIILLTMSGCAKKMVDVSLVYRDDDRGFDVTIQNELERCTDVGYKIYDGSNKIRDFWIKGAGRSIKFWVDGKSLPFGDLKLEFYCDDRPYENIVFFKNSKYPLVNMMLYNEGDFKNKYTEYAHLLKSKELYNELKNITLEKTEKVIPFGQLYGFLPDEFKIDIMKSYVTRGYDKNLTEFVLSNLNSIAHDVVFAEVFAYLFDLNVKWVDIACLDYLSNYPTKEYFDKFFVKISNKNHLTTSYMNFIDYKLFSPFVQESFKYLENRIRENKVDNEFLKGLYEKYVLLSDNVLNFADELIKSRESNKIRWAMKILKDRYDFNTSGVNEFNVPLYNEKLFNSVKNNWTVFTNEEKRFFVSLYEDIIIKDIPFYEVLLKDKSLWDIVLPLSLKMDLKTPNKNLVEFYLKLLEDKKFKDYALEFFIRAEKEYKALGLKRYYEIYNDFYIVDYLLGIDDDFYAKEHLKVVKKEVNRDLNHSIDALLNFKDRYCGVFYEMSKKELNLNDKISYLLAYAKCSKEGEKIAFDFLITDINNKSYSRLFDYLIKSGDEIYLDYFVKNFKYLELDRKKMLLQNFVGRPISKYCKYLDLWFKENPEEDLRVDILWAYVYSCPIEFFDWIKDKQISSDYFLNQVTNAYRDIFFYLGYKLNDKMRVDLLEFYKKHKNKYVIDKMSEILVLGGDEKDIEFFKKLIEEADDENKEEIKNRYEDFLEKLGRL